jgi:hypothetical protein
LKFFKTYKLANNFVFLLLSFEIYIVNHSKMSTSQLTKEQQEKLSHVSFMGGVKGAAFGLGLGLISTVVAQRRSPNFQALTTPLKSAMIGSGKFQHFCRFVIGSLLNYSSIMRISSHRGRLLIWI